MKNRWLDRDVAHPGPCLTLCLSKAEYLAALKDCGVAPVHDWIKTPQADATAHYLENSKGQLTCIVCLGDCSGRTAVEIAGLLIHESVHVWQRYCDYIGEVEPGMEQEAYGIQSIAQTLLAEYSRRLK